MSLGSSHKLRGEKVRLVQIKTERKQNSAQGRLSVPNTENSFLTSNSLLNCLPPPCHQWWALSDEWQSNQHRERLTVTYDQVTKREQFTTLKACPKLNPDLKIEFHSYICYGKHKGSTSLKHSSPKRDNLPSFITLSIIIKESLVFIKNTFTFKAFL